MDKDIHDSSETRNFTRRHQAGKNNSICQSQLRGLFLESALPRTAAHQEKARVWNLFDQFWCDGEEIVMPFQFTHPRDFTDDEMLRFEPESLALSGIVFGTQKRFEGKSAEHALVNLRPANPGSKI